MFLRTRQSSYECRNDVFSEESDEKSLNFDVGADVADFQRPWEIPVKVAEQYSKTQ